MISLTRPKNPSEGDTYVDVASSEIKVYMGGDWLTVANNIEGPGGLPDRLKEKEVIEPSPDFLKDLKDA